ncbi:MAG: hypothetical protein EAZ97_07845 [Bacteroidetes bacterium]|nr:MAG: hypothetical protein EAZ97_07845 [Bacteroidota bacterium]
MLHLFSVYSPKIWLSTRFPKLFLSTNLQKLPYAAVQANNYVCGLFFADAVICADTNNGIVKKKFSP